MKVFFTVSSKKEDPLLPQTIEDSVEKAAVKKNPDKLKEKLHGSEATKKKNGRKKFIASLIDWTLSLIYALLFMILWLAPGFMMGWGVGGYYQGKRLEPYVRRGWKLSMANWKLATELLKVEDILLRMESVDLYMDDGEVVQWNYTLKEGNVFCSYSPQQHQSTDSLNMAGDKSKTDDIQGDHKEDLEVVYEEDIQEHVDPIKGDYIEDVKVAYGEEIIDHEDSVKGNYVEDVKVVYGEDIKEYKDDTQGEYKDVIKVVHVEDIKDYEEDDKEVIMEDTKVFKEDADGEDILIKEDKHVSSNK